MKYMFAILALSGFTMAAHADEGVTRTFEITVSEVLPGGAVASLSGPATISVRCGKAGAVRMQQETTYLSNPPQTGPGVVFTGQIETSGCKERL